MTLHIVLGGDEYSHNTTSVDVETPQPGPVDPKYMGSAFDKHDMMAMGRPQTLLRNFRFISILAFGCTSVATWERILGLMTVSLMNGGTAGMIWGFLGVAVGFTLVYASVSEMASIAPTSGGQYHWVSEFAPRNCQKFLSYITGWLNATGWQCGNVAVAYFFAVITQGLLINEDPTYEPQAWHRTLLVIAVGILATLVNTLLAKNVHMVGAFEGLILMIHVVGLFIIIIPLWVLAPRNINAAFEFNNMGGWPGPGLATMVGLSPSVVSLIGHDGAVHMAEEINDASKTLPRAIMSAVGLNAALGLAVIITISATLGDMDSVLESPTHVPFIPIFYNTTHSCSTTKLLASVVLVNIVSSVITGIASASRMLWSFARDEGLPFSSFFSHVSPRWNVPLNAVIVSLVVITILSLIDIGSIQALSAVVTIANSAGTSSFILSIGCILLKRLRGERLPPRRWSLGRFGMAINIASLIFLLPVFVFSFFPGCPTPSSADFNWGLVMYLGVVVFASVYYYFCGRFHFIAPVALVKRDV